MRCITKKYVIQGFDLNKEDCGETIFDLDHPFQGKVNFKFHKDGKTLVLEFEVDGYEFL